jgi:hypothetical protein
MRDYETEKVIDQENRRLGRETMRLVETRRSETPKAIQIISRLRQISTNLEHTQSISVSNSGLITYLLQDQRRQKNG